MDRIEYLEEVSEKIRAGEPVSMRDAILAIKYQKQLRAEREANKWHRRLRRWIKAALGGGGGR